MLLRWRDMEDRTEELLVKRVCKGSGETLHRDIRLGAAEGTLS